MFQPIVKKSELISDLTNLYGSKITTADVKGYCASHGYKYYTITRYLKDFKVTRGKWNLKVTPKRLLKSKDHLKHPLHYLQHNNHLSLLKMILSSSLVVFKTLKRLFSLVFFILLLSLVSLEMVKHFL